MSTTTTIQDVAAVGYEAFETAERPSGESYVRVKDGSPQWITDAIKDAHDGGDILPDDWTYATAHSAFECISEADDPEDARHEWADAEVDVYTSARIAWLGDYPGAVECCDEAVAEGIVSEPEVLAIIAAGQYIAAGRVYDAILRACEAQEEEA